MYDYEHLAAIERAEDERVARCRRANIDPYPDVNVPPWPVVFILAAAMTAFVAGLGYLCVWAVTR